VRKEPTLDPAKEFGDQADRLISSGNKELDYVLGGGLSPNCFILVEGDPGAGKTTLAIQFILEGVRRGESNLYLGLAEGTDELESVTRSHGMSLEGINVVDLSPGHGGADDDSSTLFHPSEVELGELTQAIKKAFDKYNPQRVVLDSLGELRHLSQNELRYRRQLIALKSFFRTKECTVLLIDDRHKDVDLQLQAIARGTIELQRFTPSYGRIRRRLQVSKMRGQKVRSGFHEFTIETGGVWIYPRLVAGEHLQDFDQSPLSSGLSELDDLLGEGLERGTSTLIVGAAGTGKSTLSGHYATAAVEQGEAAAIYIFDETAGNYLRRCDAMGIPCREQRDDGKLILRQVDSAELSPAEFAWHVRHAVEESNVSVVVIDSLNGLMHSMPDEHYLRGHLHELLTFLSQLGVTTIITLSQHGLIGHDVESPVETSYLADTNILLRYFEHSGRVHKAISVLKKRTGGHETTIRELAFSKNGIQVGAPLHEFSGVLTGVPKYSGKSDPLLNSDLD